MYHGTVNGHAKTFLERIYPSFSPSKKNTTLSTKFGKMCDPIDCRQYAKKSHYTSG